MTQKRDSEVWISPARRWSTKNRTSHLYVVLATNLRCFNIRKAKKDRNVALKADTNPSLHLGGESSDLAHNRESLVLERVERSIKRPVPS